MKKFIKFVRREDGLVTLEWVGIAAVMVLAGVAITAYVMQGADEAGGDVRTGVTAVAEDATDPAGPGTFGDGVADAIE